MTKILEIGDGEGSVAQMPDALNHGQFDLDYAAGEAEALHALSLSEYDLILIAFLRLDLKVSLLCQQIRRLYGTPIVVCSMSGQEQDVVRALEAGADDYLVVPIRPVELTARLRAVLRRTGDGQFASTNGHRLIAGDIELLVEEHEALRAGIPLELSPIEFKLLTLLVRETGRAVSHSKLIAHVWGPQYLDCRHYLRLYIRYLRSKVEDNPRNPERILNEWGVGYRYEPKLVAERSYSA